MWNQEGYNFLIRERARFTIILNTHDELNKLHKEIEKFNTDLEEGWYITAEQGDAFEQFLLTVELELPLSYVEDLIKKFADKDYGLYSWDYGDGGFKEELEDGKE